MFSLRGGDENRGLCVEKYSFASDNIGDYDRLILKTVASNMVNLRLRNSKSTVSNNSIIEDGVL